MREQQQERMDQLIQNFLRFSHFIRSRSRSGELKQGEMSIIRCLSRHTDEETPELKPSQISSYLGLQQPTITPLLRNLEEKGYVLRRNGVQDRREVYISLSGKSLEYLQLQRVKTAEMFQGLCDHLGEEKTGQLMDLMEEVSDYLMSCKQEEMRDGCRHRGEPPHRD